MGGCNNDYSARRARTERPTDRRAGRRGYTDVQTDILTGETKTSGGGQIPDTAAPL